MKESCLFPSAVHFVFVSFCFSFQALIESTSSESSLQDEIGVRMVALFDHEEVGSSSAQGAGSPVMLDALSRITSSFSSDTKVPIGSCHFIVLAFLLSSAHASKVSHIFSNTKQFPHFLEETALPNLKGILQTGQHFIKLL